MSYVPKRFSKIQTGDQREAKPSATAVRVMRDQREICQQQTKAGADEYRLRRMLMRDRQRCLCALCGLWMSEEDTTFDHERSRGGGKRDDRIIIDGKWLNAAVHYRCNSDKGSRMIPYVITQDVMLLNL